MDKDIKINLLVGELLTWTPKESNDSFKKIVLDIGGDAIDTIQEFCQKVNVQAANNAYTAEVDAGIKRLRAQFTVAVNRGCTRADGYCLRNVFGLEKELVEGGFVRLPGTKNLDFTVSKAIDDEIKQTESALVEEIQRIYELSTLKTQLDTNLKTLERLEALIPPAQLGDLAEMATTAATVAESSEQLDKTPALKRTVSDAELSEYKDYPVFVREP